ARASGGGCRRSLGGGLVQVADLVGQLRALRYPVVDAGGVEHDALLGALGDGVVVAHALDVAAVPRAARVGDDDVVEGALLGAAAGEADLDHGGFRVAQSPGWRGKPGIVAQGVAVREPPGRFSRAPAISPSPPPGTCPGAWRPGARAGGRRRPGRPAARGRPPPRYPGSRWN